jgi:hypothetical protein
MSKDTARLSVMHAPLGTKPLFGTPGLKLPAYMQNIAKALMRDEGFDKARAIATAISRCRAWSRGGGGVGPEVQAAAKKAVAEFDAARSVAKSTPDRGDKIKLAARLIQELDILLAVRHVRTPAGVKFYHKPIGSIIVTDKSGQAKKVLEMGQNVKLGGKDHKITGVTKDGEKVTLKAGDGKVVTMDPDMLPGSKVSNYRSPADQKVGTKKARARAQEMRALRKATPAELPPANAEPKAFEPAAYQQEMLNRGWKKDTFAELRKAYDSSVVEGFAGADEQVAIDDYAANGYRKLNKALRQQDQKKLDSDWTVSKVTKKSITYAGMRDLLTSAMSRSKTSEDLVAFRGTGSGRALQGLKVGDTMVDRGFVSTSLNPGVTGEFQSFDTKVDQILEISVPKGTPALKPSPAEFELLFGPGTKMRVTEISDKVIKVVIV